MNCRSLAVVPCLLVIGCAHRVDPYAFLIPGSMAARDQEHSEMFERIRLLSKDEQQMVQMFINDEDTSEQNTGFPGKDITVAEIIKEETPAFLKQRKADIAEAQGQIDYQRRKADRLAEFGKILTVSLLNKQSVRVADDNAGTSQPDEVVVSIGIENKSSKAIRILRGTLNLTDSSHEPLTSIHIDQTAPVAAGKTVLAQTVAKVSNDAAGEKLFTLPLADINAEFMPESLLFADGTSLDMNVPGP